MKINSQLPTPKETESLGCEFLGSWELGVDLFHRLNEPLHFCSLRGIRRESSKEFFGRLRGVVAASGAGEGYREGESRLVQVGIHRQRAPQRLDGALRVAAIGQHDAEIGEDDGIARLGARCCAQRLRGLGEFALQRLARGEPQMCVCRRQACGDSGAEPDCRLAAAIRFQQDVPESKICLRVVRILRQHAAKRPLQLGPL